MRVLVTGATGFIGQRLLGQLAGDRHEIWALTRDAKAVTGATATVIGDLSREAIDLRQAAPEAVVHLAGESVGAGRWSPARKARILDSRVQGSRHLAESLARLAVPPRVAIVASGVGYYGDRGDELLTETSAKGEGFLADVCEAWEAEAQKLLPNGRVVSLRIGLCLGAMGGALPSLARPFRLFAGGPLGSGRQWMSWIHVDDVCGLIRLALARDDARGPINAVGPEPLRNRDVARLIGRLLGRPSFVPAPAPALRLLLGAEMARELLLSGQRVVPERAVALGYDFLFPEPEAAFRAALEA
ncbi:MAG: TIGR01777 family oxidoreductase [Deltaproteobacteria bacterium]